MSNSIYAERAAQTAQIVSDMMNMEAGNFTSRNSDYLLNKISSLLYDWGIKGCSGKTVRFGDILCLLHFLPDCPRYSYCDRKEREQMRNDNLFTLFSVMHGSMEGCETVRRFMSLPINEYFDHLSRKSGIRSEVEIPIYTEFLWEKTIVHTEYGLNEESTVEDLYDGMEKVRDEYRERYELFDDYKRAVDGFYDDLYYFFIKYVRKEYDSFFYIDKLIERYKSNI